jgi:phenylpropionate dioxygenase-like ring-hydroxylating dioxygenase large terminal subunit
VRDDEGQINAFSSVCRHRGMVIATDSGNCGKRFKCPYHWWSYGMKGELLGAPMMNKMPGYDKSELGLPNVQCDVWEGFIFINFDEDARPYSEVLEGLGSYLANYRLGELKGGDQLTYDYEGFDWKVFWDNTFECYHCGRLHSDTYIDNFPVENQTQDSYQDPDNGVFTIAFRGKCKDATISTSGVASHPVIPSLSDEDRWHYRFALMAPSLLIGAQCDQVHYVSWWPDGFQKLRIKVDWLYPQETLDSKDFAEHHASTREAFKSVWAQDELAWVNVARGLKSKWAPRGPYSAEELALIPGNQWIVDKYRAALGDKWIDGTPDYA